MSMNVNENRDITRPTITVTSSENVLTNVAIDRPYTIPVTDVRTIEIPQELQERITEIEEIINQRRQYQYAQMLRNQYQKLSNSKNKKSNNICTTDLKESKMTYKYEKCPCCGKRRRDYNFTEVNGEKICFECKRKYYLRDHITREWIKIRNLDGTMTNDIGQIGGYLREFSKLETLQETGYKKCPECRKWHKQNMFVTTEDGKTICIRCAERDYFKCEHCGKWKKYNEKADGNRYSGQNLCTACVLQYYQRCPRCHRYHRTSDMRTIHGETVCQRCYTLIASQVIHSYHDSNVRYVKKCTQNDLLENCYFGFELEVSGDRGLASDFLKIENIDSDVVLMSDSSIRGGGFEIVTMPMTKNYINEAFIPKFTKALQFLRDNDFKGHNYGGLHIHVSQDAISNKQVAHLSEILYGNYRDQKIWLGITQRKANEMQSWSKMTNRIGDFYSAHTIPDQDGKAAVGSPRYTALCKDDRTKTYEFRIFNSNLRIERFLKNYECVLALLDYTKENEENTLPVCNTVGFIEYVYSNREKYENLYNFFVERQIKEHYRNGYQDYEIERVA